MKLYFVIHLMLLDNIELKYRFQYHCKFRGINFKNLLKMFGHSPISCAVVN